MHIYIYIYINIYMFIYRTTKNDKYTQDMSGGFIFLSRWMRLKSTRGIFFCHKTAAGAGTATWADTGRGQVRPLRRRSWQIQGFNCTLMFFFFTLVNVRTLYHRYMYIYMYIDIYIYLIYSDNIYLYTYIYIDLMMIHMFHPSLFFLLCGLKHWTSLSVV